MVRTGHCARPGCGEPAIALLTYDYGERVAWLDRLIDVNGNAWPLCIAHADRLKVPIGWTKEDRRVRELPMQAQPEQCALSAQPEGRPLAC